MQQRFGIATRLHQTFKHQITSRSERRRGLRVPRHALVRGVACVLADYHGGHALEGFLYLCMVDQAMQQPAGHVLTADAQGCGIFHQADVLDVGHLGADYALVNPAHDVAVDTLDVVVEFCCCRILAETWL